jgi:hypothetical protein
MSTANTKIINGPKLEQDSIDHQELFFARRALALLKERLGPEGLTELLKPDIDAADQFWKRMIEQSHDEWREITVTIHFSGLSCKEFLAWFHANSKNMPVMQAAHPEHYLNGFGPVLETVGDQVSYFNLELSKDPHPCVTTRDPARYPLATTGSGKVRNGMAMGHACHQFREFDEGVGFEARFGGWVPAATSEEVVEMQRRHLVVEWRNWFEAACRELKGN